MAESLYLTDCYLGEFDAIVNNIKDNKYVVLDKSAFYPVGGGQPHDTGKMICNNIEYNVVFVGSFNGEVSHEVDKPGLKEGDKVHCVINWNRRYKLMRMHTATHILCGVINKETGAIFTGNQLGEDKTRIDLSLDSFDKEMVQRFIEKANEEIRKNKDIKISFVSREEGEKLSKLSDWDYSGMDKLRIIDVEDLDIQPCGGCHVKNTSEIKGIEFVSIENKGKGRKRIYFKLID